MKKLVWLTDLHLVEQGRDWPQGVDPLARLRFCLDEIQAFHSDAERLVISGDLIQIGNPGAYGILREELTRISMPYRLLVGNHDNREAMLTSFPELSSVDGFIQGVEDVGNVRLLYLDTLAAEGKHHGELCPVRMQWIGEQIRSADERSLLIFLHHPPCDIGVPALDRLSLVDSDELGDLIRAREAPTHLFCGHVHRNASGLWAGYPLAALKSLHVQFELDLTGSNLIRGDEPPGYAVVLIKPNGIIVNYRDIPAL
ncbi:phosphodiesterase [Paracoccus onubensis]|uniref:Phosphodiesterase n=1 Tax=Paracoccus onubensis TaxID=1675788 RepID=A0A418T224_9RHOB|nr:phosphodiesterase [Paracoccus onubensis]RJE87251.1 phosphodiesterase [Paracoccus onubensis]